MSILNANLSSRHSSIFPSGRRLIGRFRDAMAAGRRNGAAPATQPSYRRTLNGGAELTLFHRLYGKVNKYKYTDPSAPSPASSQFLCQALRGIGSGLRESTNPLPLLNAQKGSRHLDRGWDAWSCRLTKRGAGSRGKTMKFRNHNLGWTCRRQRRDETHASPLFRDHVE